MRRIGILAVLLAARAFAQPVTGLWDAVVTISGTDYPFRIEFAGEGAAFRGWFFNGEERVPSTGGSFENGRLVLDFAHYGTRLNATLNGAALDGDYGSASKRQPFRATRHASSQPSAAAPKIDGEWEFPVQSPKGESAWRLVVRQKTGDVSAAILRIDGDTGALTGRYEGGKFVLSHYSGARPSLLVLAPDPDGSLAVDYTTPRGRTHSKAVRPEVARAGGLAGPTDPEHHTTVKDAAEPLRFSLPDLGGKIVSNTDARFRGKVVLVNIMGSWCPNCHDEAGFLAALYGEYRSRGLEIVALSFEEADQLANPVRLRAFLKQYGIEYTVLLGGVTDQLQEKLPQAVGLDSWPTTFFLGRDGRVRAVHAGFPGRASGPLYEEAVRSFRQRVESLLAEGALSKR